MSKSSVDVLITFYNQEKYVDQAICSVLKQKGDFQLRILVGDDGSTDLTKERVEQYVQEQPGIIRLFQMAHAADEKTIGGFRSSKNRIQLLRHVRADYFIFLDGDDFFDDEWKLQKQIAALEEEKNRDCVACGHAIDVLYEDGTRVPYAYIQRYKDKYSLQEYWAGFYCHTDTILARASVIKTFPAELAEHNFNDNMITFLVLTQGKLCYLPETMAVYRQTGDGVWTSGREILNYLRNIMIYDLCIRIRPDVKKATQRRFASSWKALYDKRALINKEDYSVLYDEAVSKNLRFTRLWIDYAKLTVPEKCCLLLEYEEMWPFRLMFRHEELVSKYKGRRLCRLWVRVIHKFGYEGKNPFF